MSTGSVSLAGSGSGGRAKTADLISRRWVFRRLAQWALGVILAGAPALSPAMAQERAYSLKQERALLMELLGQTQYVVELPPPPTGTPAEQARSLWESLASGKGRRLWNGESNPLIAELGNVIVSDTPAPPTMLFHTDAAFGLVGKQPFLIMVCKTLYTGIFIYPTGLGPRSSQRMNIASMKALLNAVSDGFRRAPDNPNVIR